jgi:hypothetical protein
MIHKVKPGTVVAHDVAQVLDQFSTLEVPHLTLELIIRGTLDSPCVEPAVGAELGRLIFPERLHAMDGDLHRNAEADQLHKYLADLKFLTDAAVWSGAKDLLIRQSNDADRREEVRRAAFAPREKVLAPTYSESALDFFLACRGDMRATASDMAIWILTATDDDRRRAALEYLLQGEQSPRVQQEIRRLKPNYANCWLDDRAALHDVLPSDPNRQAVIMGQLDKGEEYAQQRSESALHLATLAPGTRKPAAVLNDIFGWWQAERVDILASHDRTIYPDGKLPRLSFTASSEQLSSDVAIRREWLILFALGAMYRIGRATRHQHRGFLCLCDERGWLDILAARIEDPSTWFRVMDDYLDSLQGDAEHFQWMNQFLAYYQIARWLPNYVRAFDAVTRPGVNLSDLRSLRDIADLRTSHVFSGATGFDAPPCSRMLGIGAHFVLRETIRARAASQASVQNVAPQLESLAYVPAWRTRKLVAQVLSNGDGDDTSASSILLSGNTTREDASKMIGAVLRKHLQRRATFNGAFDIPLLVLTWRRYENELAQFLGHEVQGSDGNPLQFLNESEDSEDD